MKWLHITHCHRTCPTGLSQSLDGRDLGRHSGFDWPLGTLTTQVPIGQVLCAATLRSVDFKLRGKVLSYPGAWAWLGLGSALDRISGITRAASLRDRPEDGPHVMSGPQKHEHTG